MLQVTKNGADITLCGDGRKQGNGLFWFATALLVGAIGVAMAMSLLPERLAIGALAILIVGSFIFNKMRSKQSANTNHISSGVLKVQNGVFIHNVYGKQSQVVIEPTDTVKVIETTPSAQLLITTNEGAVKYKVSGFESAKEAAVMKAVLGGQQFGKRHANIKMQSK